MKKQIFRVKKTKNQGEKTNFQGEKTKNTKKLFFLFVFYVKITKKGAKMAKLIKVDKDLKVKKADVIVRARYRLNTLSLKFITALITAIKRSDDINEEYIVKVRDFQELMNLKRKDLYWAVKESLKELLEKPLHIPTDDGFIMCNWISGGQYVENAGEVRFMIYPKLRPYLLEAKKRFLKYRLENILNLKSSYVIRLYEILKDYLELNKRYNRKAEKIISLDEFRQMLEIPKSYQYSSHIKKLILEKAKEQLAKYTDILFDYEEIKTGRKVTHLKFIIKDNKKNKKSNRINLIKKQETKLNRIKRNIIAFFNKLKQEKFVFFSSKYNKNLEFADYHLEERNNNLKLTIYAFSQNENKTYVFEANNTSETLATFRYFLSQREEKSNAQA